MRSLSEAQDACITLERNASLDQLRSLARDRDAAGRSGLTGIRSACWKAFLSFRNVDLKQWPSRLRASRAEYDALKTRYLHGLTHADEQDSLADPLSDDLQSPWAALRQDEQARNEIFLDVERCMPDNYYFRQPSTQNLLLDVLFVWSKLTPSIGYRQGMHEILAPIVWAIERDAINPSSLAKTGGSQSLAEVIFDAAYIEHDAFNLFKNVMAGLQSAYAPPPPSRTRTAVEPPIVPRSNHIVKDLLGSTDPLLAKHLADIEVAPQLFLMRWIRLLFGREFAYDDMLLVWDLIFAEQSSAEIVDFVCLSMILRARWNLLEAGPNEALSMLLQYSPPGEGQSAVTFVEDALLLRANCNAQAGSEVILRRTGRQPAHYEQRPETPTTVPFIEKLRSSRFKSPVRRTPPHSRQSSRQSSNLEGMLQNAAKGVFSRGEQLNKAVRDAVGDLKDNVQNLRPPRSEESFNSLNGVVAEDSALQELVKQVDALQERNKALAKMLETAVNDLWKQHKEIVGDKPADDEQAQNFTMAVAKVQLAQVYLDDTSLPLPQDENEEAPKSTAETVNKDGNLPKIQSDDVQDTTSQGQSEQASIATRPGTTQKDTVGDSTSHVSELQDRNEKPVDKREDDAQKRAERPRLGQSSYSFMLGQDDADSQASRTAFVAASPFTEHKEPQETRAMGFLFGDERESSFVPRPERTLESAKSAATSPRRSKEPPKKPADVMFDAEDMSEVKL